MTEAVRPSGPAVPSIRSLWNAYKALDAGASNSEEDEDKLARRRQLWMNLSESLGTRQLLLNFQSGRPVLILRPPPDLVNFSRPRWPIECEVISDIIQHIEWEPPDPEPFYKPSGHELTPIPSGDERGKMVYCTDFAPKHLYFTCSCVGGSRDSTRSTTTLVKPSDVTLEFESRFESGNLQKAVQVGDYDYELTLRTDMYTEKHTQWFYFRVRNMKAGVTYRFTITNLMKRSSLYSQGMRPLLYSERAAKENRVGWQRAGSDIRYYRKCSQNIAEKNDAAISLYSLTWTLQFPYDSDTCYLAHCYPYTYSRLQRYLKQISSNPAVASYCKVWILCQSLAGNAVYVITITSRGTSQGDVRNRKAVVVTARVHPGETNGSWMMEGFLDFLLGDSDDAKVLRDNFIFKVVPMLNPDGVVVGNYRCSLTGRDLNRNYKTLLKDSFPCVWHTRNMVERLMAETEVVVYCDFHGHSRKNNVFMYGCNSRGDASIKLQERVFPLMMSKNASNKFSFKSCKFRVQKSKEGTGRIVMWKLGVKNSYTMEATFGGSTLDDRGGTHFTTGDLKSMGFYFCDTLLDFCDPDQTKVQYCLTEVSALLRKEIKRKMSKNLVTDGNFSLSDLETSTSGSNSSDSDGHPVHLLHQQKGPEKTPFKKKKKKLRSRRERNRFQLEQVRSNTEAKVLESSTNTIDSSLSHKSIDGERNREILVGEQRRKWQLNGLMGKSGISTPTTHAGEVSQATLWQGCKSIKEDSQETLCTSCMHHKLKHPYPSTCASMSLPSGYEEERRQVRCSSHLLTLRAPPPHLPNLVQCKRYCYPPSLSSYQGCSGLSSFFMAPSSARFPSSAFVSMVPAIAPTSPTSRSRSRQCFRNRNLLLFSNHFSTKGFSTSVTDVTKTTQRSMDQKASSEGSSARFFTTVPAKFISTPSKGRKKSFIAAA